MRFKKKVYTRIFTLGVLGFLILIPSLASASFTFPNFSSTAGLTLNENAAMSGTALRLTPALVGQRGSAWFNHQQAIDDFDTTFQFQITGDDGITFVVHNSAAGTAALGDGGGNLGYFGAGISIENSIVVEFDTFDNESHDDDNANHIGVYNLTGTSDVPSAGNRLGRADALANTIEDGGIHTARIQYSQGAPGTLDVYLDGILELSVAVDLPASVGGSPAYVGFTSATGGGFGNHDILNWSFRGVATNPDNRHAYEAVEAPNVDWDGVNAAAAALSFQGCPGHLATITSQAENDFIKNNLPAAVNDLYWLGAYQPGEPAANLPAILAPGAGWVWVTGEPFVYTNWAGGEPNDQDNDGGGAVFGPNEDALHFWVPSGKWNDRPRSWPTHVGYVVEYECAAPQIDGRMTGGGSFFAQGVRYTHGFELHCDMAQGPNNLEVNWGKGNRFKLTSLTSATCTGNDLEGKPIAGFDTYEGVGLGSLNGDPEIAITFRFTDRGEPGKDVDEAEFSIIGGLGVARTTLDKGNHQAHSKK